MIQPRYMDDEVLRPTTAEDLHKVFDCWTRVEVLTALAGPRMSAHELAAALQLAHSLLSTHLSTLRREGLARCTTAGKHHSWSLTDAARVVCTAHGIALTLRATDGSVLSFFIPRDARVMRILVNGYRLALKNARRRPAAPGPGGPAGLTVEVKAAHPGGPAPVPRACSGPPRRRASGPG